MFSSREEILKQTMHFHHMTITLRHKDPWAEGHERFTILVAPFLVIITKYIVCLIYVQE